MPLGSTLAIDERRAARETPPRGYHWHDFEWLTEQQTVILNLLCEGLRPAEIAKRLGKSHWTVRDTINAAVRRTESRTLIHLIVRYMEKKASLPTPQRDRVFVKAN